MVRYPRLLAFLLLTVALGFGSPAPAAPMRSLVAAVQHVADGDSVTALSATGTKMRVRLLPVTGELRLPQGTLRLLNTPMQTLRS